MAAEQPTSAHKEQDTFAALAAFAARLEAAEDAHQAVGDLASRRGCNRDLLILLCWLAASGRPALDGDAIAVLLDTADAWRRTVSDRVAEMALQAQAQSALLPPATLDSFLRDAAALELSARHIERALMLDGVADSSVTPAPAADDHAAAPALAHSLTAYFSALGIAAVPRDRVMVARLLRVVAPHLP
ncbi:MAG: hypothetical protein RIL09_12430, partial [Alphaproteobacteria bacterium]